MKIKTTILTLTIVSLLSIAAQAKEWSVGGPLPTSTARDAGDKVFFTLQDAHNDDEVQSGDTLYVVGRQSSYGDLTLTKELIIYGQGYFLAENNELQANDSSALAGVITFNSGSENSVIAGMSINILKVNVSDITIERNIIGPGPTSTPDIQIDNGVSNITISQNYIFHDKGNDRSRNGIFVGESNDQIVIRNNFIAAVNSGYAAIFSPLSSTNIEISHNVIRGRVIANNAKFTNNILRDADVTQIDGNISNNICNSEQLPETQDNQLNVDMATVFVDTIPGDTKWQLRPGSPAKNKGLAGVDIGMFGGVDPYRLSGIPAIPAVYSLEETDRNENSITFEVKARSNN